MKRKNFLAIFMIMAMVLGGCGNDNTKETVNTENSSEVVEQETVTDVTPDTQEAIVPSEDKDIDSLITEKTDEELDLKQFLYSYEDRTMDKEGERVFNTDLFTNPENFVTTDKLDIYNVNGIRVGYVLKNVELNTFGEHDGWYYFYLDGNQRFSRAKDIEANCKTKEQINAEEQEAEKANSSNSNTGNAQPSVPAEQETVETPAEQPVADTPVTESQTSNKYTPDEAIAVYRAAMEAGGMTWDPSIKDVTSWGTGWIYLDKGQPEWAASSNLESAAMGDSAGRSWTKYYLEVTGSDENAVYITEWTSN